MGAIIKNNVIIGTPDQNNIGNSIAGKTIAVPKSGCLNTIKETIPVIKKGKIKY